MTPVGHGKAPIFGEVANPSARFLWLNHDMVARQINSAD